MRFSKANSAIIDLGGDTEIRPYNIEGVNVQFDDENEPTEATITLKCVADKNGNILRIGVGDKVVA